MKQELMCSYSNLHGTMAGQLDRHLSEDDIEKSKWIRCPECGRRMHSAVRYCHDGCCAYHCVPPHHRKGWWRKPKVASRKRSGSGRRG